MCMCWRTDTDQTPEDERSIANKLAAAEKDDGPKDSAEVAQSKKDPTLPVRITELGSRLQT